MDRPARRPGPPVDAARLQPDNQGDIRGVDEGLVVPGSTTLIWPLNLPTSWNDSGVFKPMRSCC